MRRLASVGRILSVLVILSGALPAWAGPPTDAVKSVVDEVLRILNDPALATQKERRRQLVKARVDQRFDYEEMAKRSLGPTWARLSLAQRSEFVRLFGELLEASYYDKVDKYAGETVTFLGESVDGDYAEVRTMLVRPNDRIPMNYRLLNKSRWVIYDVVIEGVSLVSNYRSQFSQIISQSSYQELVNRLRTRVEELRRAQRGA
ncbi:MAG: ABC transporter substrate-binding protein [Syntrophobacterales bacterium]|nr:ABC transporter substrate-binding protein [Syntrophobacterales bacterium]